MPKPSNYNGVRKITTAGLTLPNGNFIGFINGTGSQQITIAGALIYNGLTRAASPDGITFNVAANAYVPVECSALRPASFDILGYF